MTPLRDAEEQVGRVTLQAAQHEQRRGDPVWALWCGCGTDPVKWPVSIWTHICLRGAAIRAETSGRKRGLWGRKMNSVE